MYTLVHTYLELNFDKGTHADIKAIVDLINKICNTGQFLNVIFLAYSQQADFLSQIRSNS